MNQKKTVTNVDSHYIQASSQIERLDERDIIFSRVLLPLFGSKEYEEYYREHPELEEADKNIRTHFFFDHMKSHERRKLTFPDQTLSLPYSHSSLDIVAGMLSWVIDPVTRFVKETFEVSDTVQMSEKIKELTLYLGADEVRIVELNQNWVYSHIGRSMIADEKWGDPVILPHKNVIVFSIPHDLDMLLANGGHSPAVHIDIGHIYGRLSAVAVRLAAIIRDMGYPARAHIASNYKGMLVPMAVDAGFGELCRIGILLTKKYGPGQRLAAVTTDLPLAADSPVDIGVQDFCSKCLKCAYVCPSGAISKGDKELVRGVWKWKANGYKCFSYWNHTGVACSRCVAVCPWTRPRTITHKAVAELASRAAFTRSFLIWADKVVYGKKPRLLKYPRWLEFKRRTPI